MKGIARFIAFLIAVILIIALPISLLIFDTGRVFFNPPLIKNVVIELVTESDLVPMGLAWYADQRAQGRDASNDTAGGEIELDIIELLSFFDVSDWSLVRSELLPDEMLVEWASVAVDESYQWIDSDAPVPEITLDLQPFIDRVDSEHGVKAIAIILNTLPPCTDLQLNNLCRFPSPWFSDQVNYFAQSLDLVVSNIPETFSLTDALDRIIDNGGVALRITALIPVALLLLILILAVRSLKTLGNWWGYPLALGSLLTLVLSQGYRQVATAVLSVGLFDKIPLQIRADVVVGIMRMASAIFSLLQTQAVALLLLGLALIIIGAVVKEKSTMTLDQPR